jgi:transcriptional regulator with XRE-family HTH domain
MLGGLETPPAAEADAVHGDDANGPALLRQIRARAGLTQEQLAGLAGLHVRTIRGLETAHVHRPRRQSLELIGQALGLDVSTVLRLVSAWGLVDADTTPPEDAGSSSDNIIDQLIRGGSSTCAPVSVSETVTVGNNRRVDRRRTEEVVVALTAGVAARYVFFEPEDDDVDLNSMRLTGTENCEVAREYVDPIRRVKVFELALSRILNENDTHVLRYTAESQLRLNFDSSPPAPPMSGQEIGGFFRSPASYLLEVRFRSGDRPRRCTHVFQARPTGPIRTLSELKVTSSATAHITLVNPKPGGHGIAWVW